MPRTRCYREGALTGEDFPIDQVSDHLNDPSAVVWVDLCAPDLEELQLVADELGLHVLAVEDAAQGRQRPKLDRYSGHDFLSRLLGTLSTWTVVSWSPGEIHAFINPRQPSSRSGETTPSPSTRLLTRWDDEADLTKFGVGALLHGLLDVLVDGHFDAVESLDDADRTAGRPPVR